MTKVRNVSILFLTSKVTFSKQKLFKRLRRSVCLVLRILVCFNLAIGFSQRKNTMETYTKGLKVGLNQIVILRLHLREVYLVSWNHKP
jgi:hypothetical protein